MPTQQNPNEFVTKNWRSSTEQFDQTTDDECDDIAKLEPEHVASYKSQWDLLQTTRALFSFESPML